MRRPRFVYTTIVVPAQTEPIWIVVPAYREAGRLGATLDALCASYPNVVVVDDGSEDRTSEVAAEHPVWVLRHLINCGQGAALQTGIDFALARGAGLIVSFDADGQHGVDDIARLAQPVLSGSVDIALGSRFLGDTVGMPWSRRFMLKAAVLFTRLVSRLDVTDTHNGLRAMSAGAARRIKITHDRMAHASEILDQIHTLGLRFCEVPVRIRYNEEVLGKGQSTSSAFRIAGQFLFQKLTR